MKKIKECNVKRSVFGLTSLNDHLYVGYSGCNEVDVFDMKENNFNKMYSIRIPELNEVHDMTSCARFQYIYIADWENKVIHRVDNDNTTLRWCVNDSPEGLSVNPFYNVLVTFANAGNINEFTNAGQLVREIKLQPDIVAPWSTIQLTTDQFVVCHGGTDDPLNRVCIVNDAGKILKSFGGSPGSGNQQLNYPVGLAVSNDSIFVVDHNNHRIVMLSSKLAFVSEVLSGLRYKPYGICIDSKTGRIFLNEGQCVQIFDVGQADKRQQLE